MLLTIGFILHDAIPFKGRCFDSSSALPVTFMHVVVYQSRHMQTGNDRSNNSFISFETAAL